MKLISFPLIFRKSLLLLLIISFSQYFTEPEMFAAWSIKLTVARAVIDLPEPLSPTKATVSPLFMPKLTFFTAALLPKDTERFSIFKISFI